MLNDDPLWYKDAVFYELHVRSFCDAKGDGVGDFAGLTSKLDYLQDLGVNALWLLPFYPSPVRDDGYDISDYTDVHPMYGTLADFKAFLREAHERGIRVVTELVLNHTSDQHPWFQRARRAKPGSRARDYYVWSDTPDRYRDARIIFKDFEPSNWSWDPVAKAYYWHRFYAHQPDLNFDNPEVRRALLRVVGFWFGLGVDGLRLDAVPYLYEREGTNCENLPETHAFLKELRAYVDQTHPNRMLLAEANQWPEDAAAYFGSGDECHMAFHFPIMPRLFMSLHMEDRFPIVDILNQTPAIPESAQWALFLRNHDELTLEMVTDEERDYMYRVYAQETKARINLGIRRRLAPLLGNNRRKMELMNGLLFSLPGTQVIYYGDEIGMGDNFYLGDRNGVRTPMQWSADKNAGFSRSNPQKLYLPIIIDPEYHYEAINVEAQQSNPQSFFWWMKRLIALSKSHKAFGRGSLEFLHPENPKVLAFLRRWQDETLLVVANLSRFTQYAELDLSAFRGTRPVELFGRTAFPPVRETPYFMTLAPHTFYWFSLAPPRAPAVRETAVLESDWPKSKALARTLADWLPERRWFRGRAIKGVTIADSVPVDGAFATLLDVEYTEGDPEMYFAPVAWGPGTDAESLIAPARLAGAEGALVDPMRVREFCLSLLDGFARRRSWKGKLLATPTPAFRRICPGELPDPSPVRSEQSHTAISFGDCFILKLYRRVDWGLHPELEILRHLDGFPHVPPLAGWLEYRGKGGTFTAAILEGWVPNQGDAWKLAQDALGRFFENRAIGEGVEVPKEHLLDLADAPVPPEMTDAIGAFLEQARLLGRRTGELHLALASSADPEFTPEPYTPIYQRSLYQSMRSLSTRMLARLRKADLPEEEAKRVLAAEGEILRRPRALLGRKLDANRIRIHGHLHLGQVLWTGKDFTFIDFEGDPARPMTERRFKRSPLQDLAAMIRSFHYAAHAALERQKELGGVTAERAPALATWARTWHAWTSAAYLRAYLDVEGTAALLPAVDEDRRMLLDLFLLNKALYELGWDLEKRPGWARMPLEGILGVVGV